MPNTKLVLPLRETLSRIAVACQRHHSVRVPKICKNCYDADAEAEALIMMTQVRRWYYLPPVLSTLIIPHQTLEAFHVTSLTLRLRYDALQEVTTIEAAIATSDFSQEHGAVMPLGLVWLYKLWMTLVLDASSFTTTYTKCAQTRTHNTLQCTHTRDTIPFWISILWHNYQAFCLLYGTTPPHAATFDTHHLITSPSPQHVPFS